MCEIDYLHLGLSLPALRGTQGGRAMYVALPSNNVINTFFPTHIEGSAADPGAHVDDGKVHAIASYIEDKSDSFVLGAIAYATDSECHFEEALPGAQFGVLRLPLNAKLRSLDGHHRREALRSVVEKLNGVGNQHTALVLYVEPRLERRRAMFNDLNRDAQLASTPPESMKVAAAHSTTTDPFRVAAEALVRTHPFLMGRVDTAQRQGKRREQDFDLKSVVDFLKRLNVGPTGRVKHPQRFDPELVQARGSDVLDGLAEAARADVTGEAVALRWRSMLRVVGGATWILTNEGGDHQLDLQVITRALISCDYAASGQTWRSSGLEEDANSSRPSSSANVVKAVNLLVTEILELQLRSDETSEQDSTVDVTSGGVTSESQRVSVHV